MKIASPFRGVSGKVGTSAKKAYIDEQKQNTTENLSSNSNKYKLLKKGCCFLVSCFPAFHGRGVARCAVYRHCGAKTGTTYVMSSIFAIGVYLTTHTLND